MFGREVFNREEHQRQGYEDEDDRYMETGHGCNIKDLKPGLFLFQFYHNDDMQWVMNAGPWTFDSALLVTNVIKQGEDLTKVMLVYADFLIQIHDLPVGFMSEGYISNWAIFLVCSSNMMLKIIPVSGVNL